MNVLFLGYWNLDDPLTKATIFPNLGIIQTFEDVKKIFFVNTERENKAPVFKCEVASSKIEYYPIFSKNLKFNFLNKILDFIQIPKKLTQFITKNNIDVVIARGAPAGALAYLAWKQTSVPFIVESFEPHADYMRESGIWSIFDLRYIFQKKWETKQKKYALGLMTVSENYREMLLSEGLHSDRLRTVPCSVDFNKFSFDGDKIEKIRNKHGVGKQARVGIYAGKFGGLYLGKEVFRLYSGAFKYFSEFYLIILSPREYHKWIYKQIKNYNLPLDQITVKSVDHNEVAEYLMMSDFAYATYKPGYYRSFLSPVKVGEYWACGLPVVLTRGVGDESKMIEGNAGVLFGPEDLSNNVQHVYKKLDELLKKIDLRKEIERLARTRRNGETTTKAYKYFLSKVSKK